MDDNILATLDLRRQNDSETKIEEPNQSIQNIFF